MTCQCQCKCAQVRTRYSTTSPLAITMLLHFHTSGRPFIRTWLRDWPPAQRSIVEQWRVRGLLIVLDDTQCGPRISLTLAGRRYAESVIRACKEVMQ